MTRIIRSSCRRGVFTGCHLFSYGDRTVGANDAAKRTACSAAHSAQSAQNPEATKAHDNTFRDRQ